MEVAYTDVLALLVAVEPAPVLWASVSLPVSTSVRKFDECLVGDAGPRFDLISGPVAPEDEALRFLSFRSFLSRARSQFDLPLFSFLPEADLREESDVLMEPRLDA
jgi:hypothetical protein